MPDQPAPCGPACTEHHTYRLDQCALSCAEVHGSVGQVPWTVPCPRCKAPVDRPCQWNDGRPSGVCCGKRWDLYDLRQAEQRPAPAASASLREQYAAAIGDRVKQLTMPAPAFLPHATPRWGATEFDLADAVLAVRDARVEELTARAEKAERRLDLAHQARRAKEHRLDGIRRALCDTGAMQDNDPYSHADLEDVIRQAAAGDAERVKP